MPGYLYPAHVRDEADPASRMAASERRAAKGCQNGMPNSEDKLNTAGFALPPTSDMPRMDDAALSELIAKLLDGSLIQGMATFMFLTVAAIFSVVARWITTGSLRPQPIFITSKISDKDAAIKAQVGAQVHSQTTGWLGALLGGALPTEHVEVLARGASDLIGNMAAAAISEEDYAWQIGRVTSEALASTSQMGIGVRAENVFVRGSLCVTRITVETIDTYQLLVKICEASGAPVSAADRWVLLLAKLKSVSERAHRWVLAGTSALVALTFAALLAKQLAPALEASLTESLGTPVQVSAKHSDDQADFFYSQLCEQDALRMASCRQTRQPSGGTVMSAPACSASLPIGAEHLSPDSSDVSGSAAPKDAFWKL